MRQNAHINFKKKEGYKELEEHTKKLLEECNTGCKMAVDNLKQLVEYIIDSPLHKTICSYIQKHGELEQESARLLKMEGWKEKEPKPLATAFSWITTEMKLMLQDDRRQIAKIVMDGCNMGIQSICEAIGKYPKASEESVQFARRLVTAEENLMREMESFLA